MKHKKRKPLDNHGFTLIELLMVIAIIAILAAIVAPSAFSTIDNAKAASVIQDMEAIKMAAFVFYADTGQFPNGTVSGNADYSLWNTDSRRMFVTGDHPNQPSGWDGPYLDSWPDKTPFGGCYTYRFLHSGANGALGWAVSNLRNLETNQPFPNQNSEVIYIRFNNDPDHQAKRDKVITFLEKKIDPELIYISNQAGSGNTGLIAIKIKR